MNQAELQKTLESLHAELNEARSVDSETRELLVTLADDIQRLSDQDLSARVSDLVLKFETDHPQLTRALNQVSAALANLGI